MSSDPPLSPKPSFEVRFGRSKKTCSKNETLELHQTTFSHKSSSAEGTNSYEHGRERIDLNTQTAVMHHMCRLLGVSSVFCVGGPCIFTNRERHRIEFGPPLSPAAPPFRVDDSQEKKNDV